MNQDLPAALSALRELAWAAPLQKPGRPVIADAGRTVIIPAAKLHFLYAPSMHGIVEAATEDMEDREREAIMDTARSFLRVVKGNSKFGVVCHGVTRSGSMLMARVRNWLVVDQWTTTLEAVLES